MSLFVVYVYTQAIWCIPAQLLRRWLRTNLAWRRQMYWQRIVFSRLSSQRLGLSQLRSLWRCVDRLW